VQAELIGETRFVADSVQTVNATFPRYIDVTNRPTDFPSFLTHMVQFDHRIFTSANVNRTSVTPDLVQTFFTTINATPLGSKFSNFAYSNSPLKVKIVVQGQPFAAGKIIASFSPNPVPKPDFTMQWNFGLTPTPNSMIVPHIVIDPSKTETYDITLPVCTPTGNWTLRNAINQGSYLMQFTFVSPLFSGTAVAPSIAVCSYVGFEEPTVEGLTLLSNDFVAEKKNGGTVSTLLKGIGKYAPLASVPFPSLTPGITLFSEVSTSMGNFLSYLGFSKPPVTETLTFPTNRNVDNWSQFDGKSNSMVLAGSQGTSLGLSAKYGGGCEDELLLQHLMNIPGLYRTLAITTASTNGTLLTNFHVSPLPVYLGDSKWCLPPMSGCVAPFSAWTGDIIYTFEVVASVFHRATIMIAWDVNALLVGLPAQMTLANAQQTLPNTVLTIAGNSSVEVRIPWAQPNFWGRVPLVNEPGSQATDVDKYNGEIYVFLVNPVTSNGSTDSLRLNIYARSDNMRLACPQANRLVSYDVGNIYIPTAVVSAQPSAGLVEKPKQVEDHIVLLSADFCESTMVEFGPKTNLEGPHMRAFGEDYHSVKQLTSKLTLTSYNAVAVATTITNPYYVKSSLNLPLYQTSQSDVDESTRYQSLFSWFAAAYLGYRGGIRNVYHFHSNDIASLVIKTHMWGSHYRTQEPSAPFSLANATNPAAVSDLFRHFAVTAACRTLTPTIDFVSPSQNRLDFVPRGVYSAGTDFDMAVCSVEKPSANGTLVCERSIASADDGNFVWFLGFPALT